MATFGKEILSGPLEKKAKHFPFSWQKRHFLLDERSLTYYSGAEVHTYQLRDFQDVLRKGKGEFEIVFSGSAPEVFPELRLHVRCAGGDDAAREWADAIAGARRNLDIGAALAPPRGDEPLQRLQRAGEKGTEGAQATLCLEPSGHLRGACRGKLVDGADDVARRAQLSRRRRRTLSSRVGPSRRRYAAPSTAPLGLV